MRFFNNELRASPQALADALSLLTGGNYNQLVYDLANADVTAGVWTPVPGVELVKLDRDNRWGLRGDMTKKLAALEVIRAAECLRLTANHLRHAAQLLGKDPVQITFTSNFTGN